MSQAGHQYLVIQTSFDDDIVVCGPFSCAAASTRAAAVECNLNSTGMVCRHLKVCGKGIQPVQARGLQGVCIGKAL